VEFIQPHLELLLRHVLIVVFLGCFIEAAGVPFPSRLLLLIAATLAVDSRQVFGLVAASTVGSLIGDHVPYLAGALSGPRILAFYCRLTLGSADCVDKTVGYFRRYGAAAILLSRFSTSVRLFASALSGCGHIAYWKFITLDFMGTVTYTTVWVTVGYLVGDRVSETLGRHHGTRLLVLVVPLTLATLIAYRLWRRTRYGSAKPDVIVAESSCVDSPTKIAST
jgi:membrane protein DedA with SNARE-associated domain